MKDKGTRERSPEKGTRERSPGPNEKTHHDHLHHDHDGAHHHYELVDDYDHLVNDDEHDYHQPLGSPGPQRDWPPCSCPRRACLLGRGDAPRTSPLTGRPWPAPE